jgi:hypothetical protein
MFGSASSEFDSQLSFYKTTLLNLYKQKTKTIAEREGLRFQYLTSMKAKLSNIQGAIVAQAYADKNYDGTMLTIYVTTFILSHIPVVTLNVGPTTSYGPNIYGLGGRLQLGMLSPITHWLSEPFSDPSNPDQAPAYKMYGQAMINNKTSDLMRDNFIDGVSVHALDENNNDQLYSFSIPPSLGWVVGMITKFRASNGLELISSYPYMADLVSRTYPAGNLREAVEQAGDMLETLLEKTKTVLKIQLDIDQTETELLQFVDQYKEYASKPSVEILHEIQFEAEKSERIPVQEVPEGATMVPAGAGAAVSVPGGELTVISSQLESPTVNSKLPTANFLQGKWPWVAGAGIVYFLLNRGK